MIRIYYMCILHHYIGVVMDLLNRSLISQGLWNQFPINIWVWWYFKLKFLPHEIYKFH